MVPPPVHPPTNHPSANHPSANHPSGFSFHLIPHTHWDREWYLTRAELQARLVPVMEAALAELERDSAARCVLDGQTVLLHDYLETAPSEEPRIARLVARGALEIGPWYVLSDLLIPSGDSLRRNLELGTLDAARFGRRLEVLYSPDAFGHPAELPALANEFGLRRAVVRRGLGRPDGADHDLYRWRTAAGAELLVHHLPAAGYDIAIDLCRPDVDPGAEWAAIRTELVGRAATREIAVFLGADHHAVPSGGALAARLRALAPGAEIRVSGLTEYFDAVERSAPAPAELQGELRRNDGHSWLLPGTHSARSRMKRRHGTEELFLARLAEPLGQLAHARGGRDQEGLLGTAWRTLLQCQFHDTLAGTTSDAVQREQEIRLESVRAISTAVAAESLAGLTGFDADKARDAPNLMPGRLVEWNPSSRARTGIRTAELVFFRRDVLVGPPGGRVPGQGPGFGGCVLTTPDGAEYPVQVLKTRRGSHRADAMRRYPDQDEVDRIWVAYQGPRLPSYGTTSLFPRPARDQPPDRELRVGPGTLANRYLSLRVSRSGTFTLEDRRSGARFAELGELTDQADGGDLYTASLVSGRPVRGGRPLSQTIAAPGPLVGAIETRWSMRSAGQGEIQVRQLVILHADSPVVRIRLDVENAARDHCLRARFPVRVGDSVMAGTSLGSIVRRLEVQRLQDPSEFLPMTAPAHRYLILQENGPGLAVLAPGFFEYAWDESRDIAITLLRAVGELSRDGLPERPGHAAWPMATPEAQEPGRHTIHLAVVPVSASEAGSSGTIETHWEDAFLPVHSLWLGPPAPGG